MNIQFDKSKFKLPFSNEMLSVLIDTCHSFSDETDAECVILSFKNKEYMDKKGVSGGIHPVEVMIKKSQSGWGISYLTEFSFINEDFGKEIDFNLDYDVFSLSLMQCELPIKEREVVDFFHSWQSNFIFHFEAGMFDEISVEI